MVCAFIGATATTAFAQMSSSAADGFGSELSTRMSSQFGVSTSSDGIDPYLCFIYTRSVKTIGWAAFGSSNFLRGFGTVGFGPTISFLTNSNDQDKNFFGQITAAIGADVHSRAEFEKIDPGKQSVSTGIGIKPSLNILLYGTTINNEEQGSMTVEGYFRAGKLSPPIGWLQVQYGLNKWLDASLYYSNDFGPMGGVVFNNDQLRLFVGGGMKGGRIGFSVSNF